MLERIREGSQGPWAWAIIGLIVISFVFAGVGSYLTGSVDDAVAIVNDQEISASDFEQAYTNQRNQMEQQYGATVSQLFADSAYLANFRQSVLDRLITDELLRQKANELNLRVSDAQIKEMIVQLPEFQVDGQFDNDRYLMLIQQVGYTPDSFRDYLRMSMTRDQLSRLLANTDFTVEKSVSQLLKLDQQTRDAEVLVIPAALFEDDVTLDDTEVQTYYENNITAFDTPGKSKIAYIQVNKEALESVVLAELDEDTLLAYYNDTIANYRTAEERQAAHILIEFGSDKAAALAKAEALLVQLQDGADFAELAKTNSADLGSAEEGGNLGYFGRDIMAPEFEDATFALANEGDISAVVETEFGYHIIKLTGIKPATTQSFASVKTEVERAYAVAQADQQYFELQQALERLAFELPDSLQDVASELELEVMESDWFTAAQIPADLDHPTVRELAFDDAFFGEGLNSEVINLDANRMLVMRVIDYAPPRTQALSEVRAQISAVLTVDKASALAQNFANEVIAAKQAGAETLAEQLGQEELQFTVHSAVARRSTELAEPIRAKLFSLSSADALAQTTLANKDVAVVNLLAVNANDEIDADELDNLLANMTRQYAQQSFSDFVAALREQATITTKL